MTCAEIGGGYSAVASRHAGGRASLLHAIRQQPAIDNEVRVSMFEELLA